MNHFLAVDKGRKKKLEITEDFGIMSSTLSTILKDMDAFLTKQWLLKEKHVTMERKAKKD